MNRTDLLSQLYPRGIGQIPRSTTRNNGDKASGHKFSKNKHGYNPKNGPKK